MFNQDEIYKTWLTVLPDKSDSDVVFCLQSYQGPQDRINTQVIYPFALAQVECTSKCFT